MRRVQLHILGCGSALPTTRHNASSQVLSIGDNLFMFDCGEGTQAEFRRQRLNFSRLNHLFISHLHGDHCFGLIGLISTLGLLGRRGDLHLYLPAGGEDVFLPQIRFFCKDLPFSVLFHTIEGTGATLLYEDRTITIQAFPLKHRIPTYGFRVDEKPKTRHILRPMIDFYQVPVSALASIKQGADFVAEDGCVVENERLTSLPSSSFSYAYVSDTAYAERIVPYIQGVTLLYHEATFAQEQQLRAKQTFHSTAKQAASIAKQAEVGRLLLGHYSARYETEEILLEEASAVFPHTLLAQEGEVFTL